MALRILFLLLGLALVVNAVLITVGLIMNVNLYKKYGKQILNFFGGVVLFIIAIYIIFAIIGLK